MYSGKLVRDMTKSMKKQKPKEEEPKENKPEEEQPEKPSESSVKKPVKGKHKKHNSYYEFVGEVSKTFKF